MQENLQWSDLFMDYIYEFPFITIYARKVKLQDQKLIN